MDVFMFMYDFYDTYVYDTNVFDAGCVFYVICTISHDYDDGHNIYDVGMHILWTWCMFIWIYDVYVGQMIMYRRWIQYVIMM